MTSNHGFTRMSDILPGVLKEISRRAELRLRLEAEQVRAIHDETFLNLAGWDEVEL